MRITLAPARAPATGTASHRPDGVPAGRVSGDLILPGANVVVDRGIANARVLVWDVLGHVFEPEDESTIMCGRGCILAVARSRGIGHVRHCSAAALAFAHAFISANVTRLGRDRACVGWRRRRVAVVAVVRDLRDACVGEGFRRCLVSLVPAVSVGRTPRWCCGIALYATPTGCVSEGDAWSHTPPPSLHWSVSSSHPVWAWAWLGFGASARRMAVREVGGGSAAQLRCPRVALMPFLSLLWFLTGT